MGNGRWFRQIRRDARSAVYENRKQLGLWCGAVAVGILTSIVISHSPTSVFLGSVATFGLASYALWHHSWISGSKRRRICAVSISGFVISLVAYASWPEKPSSPPAPFLACSMLPLPVSEPQLSAASLLDPGSKGGYGWGNWFIQSAKGWPPGASESLKAGKLIYRCELSSSSSYFNTMLTAKLIEQKAYFDNNGMPITCVGSEVISRKEFSTDVPAVGPSEGKFVFYFYNSSQQCQTFSFADYLTVKGSSRTIPLRFADTPDMKDISLSPIVLSSAKAPPAGNPPGPKPSDRRLILKKTLNSLASRVYDWDSKEQTAWNARASSPEFRQLTDEERHNESRQRDAARAVTFKRQFGKPILRALAEVKDSFGLNAYPVEQHVQDMVAGTVNNARPIASELVDLADKL